MFQLCHMYGAMAKENKVCCFLEFILYALNNLAKSCGKCEQRSLRETNISLGGFIYFKQDRVMNLHTEA